MSGGERTFCRLEVKWLCQKSVMRSVSGERVASISASHQAFSSSARSICRRTNALRSSSPMARTARGSVHSSTQAGGGVRAARVHPGEQSLDAFAPRVSFAYSSICAKPGVEAGAVEKVARLLRTHPLRARGAGHEKRHRENQPEHRLL